MLAILFDVLMISLVSGEILALVVASNENALPLSMIIGVPTLVVFAVVAYHLFFAGRVLFMSLGERTVGFVVQNAVKKAENPYTISRWPLFLLMLFTFVLGCSISYAGLAVGDHYQIQLVALRLLFALALIIGSVLTGMGKSFGFLLPAVCFAILALRVQLFIPPYSIRWVLVAFLGLVALVHGVLGLVYTKYARGIN